jgi:hypothetical protein
MGHFGDVRIEFRIDAVPDNQLITERFLHVRVGHRTVELSDPWALRFRQELWRSKDDGAIVTYPDSVANVSVAMGIPPLMAGGNSAGGGHELAFPR